MDNVFIIMDPIVDKEPALLPVFLVFLLLAHYGLLNIITGVLVETMLTAASQNEEKILANLEAERLRTIDKLAEVFEIADENGDGTLTFEEVTAAFEQNEEVRELMRSLDLDLEESENLFAVLDADESGEVSIEEFFSGCFRLKGTAKNRDMTVDGKALETTMMNTNGM